MRRLTRLLSNGGWNWVERTSTKLPIVSRMKREATKKRRKHHLHIKVESEHKSIFLKLNFQSNNSSSSSFYGFFSRYSRGIGKVEICGKELNWEIKYWVKYWRREIVIFCHMWEWTPTLVRHFYSLFSRCATKSCRRWRKKRNWSFFCLQCEGSYIAVKSNVLFMNLVTREVHRKYSNWMWEINITNYSFSRLASLSFSLRNSTRFSHRMAKCDKRSNSWSWAIICSWICQFTCWLWYWIMKIVCYNFYLVSVVASGLLRLRGSFSLKIV